MKRALSFILCIVMCFSLFTGTAVQVAAVGAADRIFSVKSGFVSDGKITYTISLAGGIEGFGGAVVLIEYDNKVLEPVECLPAYTNTGVQQFKGAYEHGVSKQSEGVYAVAYTNTAPESTKSTTEFFKLTFKVIDNSRPTTAVNFYCKEFFSTEDTQQSITVADGLQVIAKITETTLEVPNPDSAQLLTNAVLFSWKESVGAEKYEIRRKTPVGAWDIVATVSADNLFYKDVGLESGNTYIYSVKAINKYGESLFDSNGVSCKYISKPSNVKALNGVGGIDVTWDAVNGADSYKIVRRELGSVQWTVVSERSADLTTSYKDTTVENGKTYEYDVNSTLGSFTTETLEEGKPVTYLPSPSVTSVANINAGIEIKWNFVENAAYYCIYRRAVGVETEFREYATVVSNSFIDTEVYAGKAYTYSIKAVNDYGESAFTKTGYTLTRVPSTTVTELVAQADNIKVSWEAVSGVDGYNIYRKTENGVWQKAGVATKSATDFEDKNAGSGKSYFYCAVPFIGSSESEKTTSDFSVYYLKAPQNVTAVNGKNSIKVSWSASAGTVEYLVFRKDGLTDDNSRLVALVDGGETEFSDTDVELGAIYSYYVQARSTVDESKLSDITSAVKRILCVEKIKTSIKSNGVQITWKEHSEADSYIVCRRSAGKWTRIIQTEEPEYFDASPESGQIYAYSVIPVVGTYEGGIDETAVSDIKFLVSPVITGITNTADSIVLSWEKSNGAKTYEIQRASADSDGNRTSSFKTIATVNADKTSYTDKSVKAGKSCIYRVYAADGNDKSVASGNFHATFFAKQSIKSLSNVYGGVKITWYKNSGAQKYRIYRKEAGGEWVHIKTVSSSVNSYVDKEAKNGVKTSYAVRAQNGSSMSRYKAKTFTYFASPEVKVSNKTSAITVTWSKISGAKSYYVYRKAPGDSGWKKQGIVTKNIYTDRDVKNGKIYKYTVKAYDGTIFSGYNDSGWEIKRLSAPKLEGISNSTSGITLSWGKSVGASKYIVYRKSGNAYEWEKIATVKALEYTDTTAENGKIYSYTVVAASGDSRSTYIADGLSMKRLTRPSLKKVQSSKDGVTVKWGEVTGASGYLVYRKTGSSGKWEQIDKISGRTKTSYTDKTAKKGKTYYYTVRAYSGSYRSTYNKNGLKIKT